MFNNMNISTVYLTKRQFDVFTFIKDFIEEKGYSPSFQEIGKGVGISKQAVGRYIDLLVRRGLIGFIPYEHRNIKLKKEHYLIIEKN